jgi:hypothetical protein
MLAPPAGRHLHGVHRTEPPVGKLLDPLDADALTVGLRPFAQNVATVERRTLLGDALSVGETLGHHREAWHLGLARRPPIEQRDDLLAAEPELRSARPPVLAQPLGRHVVVLGLPRTAAISAARADRPPTRASCS